MEKRKVMPQEIFDFLVEDAIDALRESGLDKKDMFKIIKEQIALLCE